MISDDNDVGYLRGLHNYDVIFSMYNIVVGSITGKCMVDGKPGYLVNTGGKQPLRFVYFHQCINV